MTDESQQVVGATNPDEELELDLELDGTEDTDALKDALAKEQEAKRQILARAKKAEGELKELKTPKAPAVSQDTAKPNTEDEIWSIAEMIREGYDRQDVDFIRKNGGKDALNDPNSYVAIALRHKMEQKRAEAAASQTSFATGASEVERKYTPEQLEKMSSKELAKILPHA